MRRDKDKKEKKRINEEIDINNKEKESVSQKENESINNEENMNKKKDGKFKKGKQPKKKRFRKLRIFIRIVLILIILTIMAGAGIFAGIFFSDKWAITKDDLVLNKINTTVLDKDGDVIATVSGDEKRKIASLEEIPDNLKNAFIAIEDETFYKHKGINFKRTAGATLTYLLNKGSSSFGGSTITQQLIKNLMNDKDNSGTAGIQRKIREMSRAYQVEKMLSKDQILELYLNIIFMGGDVYGVELGSEYYFSKSLDELDLAECAFLAGINRSPNNYNPFDGTDRTEVIKKRIKVVLGKMKELGYINEDDYKAAVEEANEGIKFEKGNTSTAATMSYLAKAALNQVVKQYAEEKGVTEDFAKTKVYGGGFKIYSTQDSDIQEIMEDVFTNKDYIIYSHGVQVQSAMAIIDHKTGNVVGLMGGLGDDVDSNGLNRATQATRQPGSSMKPIASIAPALEAGVITGGTVYDDSPTSFGKYRPKNSGGSYHGLITVRKAIEVSANVVEVKIMAELGALNSIQFLREKMGITSLVTAQEDSEHNDEGLGMVLGGITKGISPLEMAGAYAAIANDGLYITPTMYTKMEDNAGNVVLEPKQEKIRAMSEGNAFIEKSILTGPVTGAGGTARNCTISGFDVGAKTGTTNDNSDRWLCGFTNEYTAATWYGFDKPETIRVSGSNPASRIWIDIMRKIHKDLEGSRFEKPDSVTSATICMDTGLRASGSCDRTYTEYFVRGTVPDECEGHKTVTICSETGMIATEFCPDKEEKTCLVKPPKEQLGLWHTDDEDKYGIPEDTCTEHQHAKHITMPNVIGMKVDEAKAKLKALGLVVIIETKTSKKIDGIVMEQSKEEGAQLNEGDTVTLVVSKMEDIPPEEDTNSEPPSEDNPTNDEPTNKET